VNILERAGSVSDDDAEDTSVAAPVSDQLSVAVVGQADSGSWAIVAANGEIDIASAPSLRDALEAVIAPGARVVLDLSGVSFMDSTGLSVVIAAFKRLTGAGGELRLVVAGERLRTLFTITKLSGVLPMFASVADAQASPVHPAN